MVKSAEVDDYEWQERAGILQYDAGFSRPVAEKLAAEKPWQSDPHYWDMICASLDIFGGEVI